MASPQRENGHIDIANAIADKFCSYRLSGQEWQIVWVVLRKTWGWLEDVNDKNGPKKKMDRIALSQFEKATGIDRRKCHSLLQKLVKKRVLKRSIPQKGDRVEISYGFQKNFDLWRLSPKRVIAVTHMGDRLSPKKAHTKETIQKKETYTVEFEKFWTIWPKKVNKKKAFETWQKMNGELPLLDVVLKSVRGWAETKEWKKERGQYIPHPTTWLNGHRWEDEIPKSVDDDVPYW